MPDKPQPSVVRYPTVRDLMRLLLDQDPDALVMVTDSGVGDYSTDHFPTAFSGFDRDELLGRLELTVHVVDGVVCVSGEQNPSLVSEN